MTPPATTTFTNLAPARKIQSKIPKRFQTDDWKIVVSGECEKPGTYGLEDLVKPFPIEERIYRLALCRSLVDGHSVVGHPAGINIEHHAANFQGKVRGLQDPA